LAIAAHRFLGLRVGNVSCRAYLTRLRVC
jgi:hypothetical protein